MRNETTAMTANSARKSPNRLMTCAYHTRRITVMRRTSRKDNTTGGAATVAVVMGSRYCSRYAFAVASACCSGRGSAAPPSTRMRAERRMGLRLPIVRELLQVSLLRSLDEMLIAVGIDERVDAAGLP